MSARTLTATLRSNGRIAIPGAILEAAGPEEGDAVEIVLVEDGILLRPSGGERHASGEDLLAALRAEVHGQ